LLQRGHLVGDRAELRPERERLLEVVADDLLVLRGAVSRRLLEERGELLVQPGARLLRQAAIGGVADEDVAEAVGVLAAEQLRVGEDDLLPQQPFERLGTVSRSASGVSARTAPQAEDAADHRRALEDLELGGREPVEPRREHGLDRGRQHDLREVADRLPAGAVQRDQPLVEEHPRRLLDEERVALGGLGDARGDLRRDVVAEQVRDQRAGRRLRERVEHDGPRRRRGRQEREHLGQIGPGGADDEDRARCRRTRPGAGRGAGR
jgi:hypothetical protein